MVSHQFKTPLASLQLSLETMSLRALPPEASARSSIACCPISGRMEGLVTRILDSVRLERGRVTLRNEPIDLAAAVSRVVGQLSDRASKDKVGFSVDVPKGLELLADPLAVDVVIRNLIENALAAVVPVGGGTITLNGRRLANEIELTVRDSGVGFRPEDGVLLFQKFSRLHPGGGTELLRHRAGPVHRSSHDAARRRARERAQRWRGAGARCSRWRGRLLRRRRDERRRVTCSDGARRRGRSASRCGRRRESAPRRLHRSSRRRWPGGARLAAS